MSGDPGADEFRGYFPPTPDNPGPRPRMTDLWVADGGRSIGDAPTFDEWADWFAVQTPIGQRWLLARMWPQAEAGSRCIQQDHDAALEAFRWHVDGYARMRRAWQSAHEGRRRWRRRVRSLEGLVGVLVERLGGLVTLDDADQLRADHDPPRVTRLIGPMLTQLGKVEGDRNTVNLTTLDPADLIRRPGGPDNA